MRYLLALCMLLLSTALYAQTVSFSGRIGMVPFNPPESINDLKDVKTGTSFLYGLKVAYEDKITQVGLSLDGTSLLYSYSKEFQKKPMKFSFKRPVFNPTLSVNFKTSKKQQYLFFGFCGGLFVTGKEEPDISYDGQPIKLYSNSSEAKGAGVCFGLQLGAQLEMAPHFYVNLEAGARYATLKLSDYGIKYDPSFYGYFGFYGNQSVESTEVFYFPLILSLKYEI